MPHNQAGHSAVHGKSIDAEIDKFKDPYGEFGSSV